MAHYDTLRPAFQRDLFYLNKTGLVNPEVRLLKKVELLRLWILRRCCDLYSMAVTRRVVVRPPTPPTLGGTVHDLPQNWGPGGRGE